MTVEFQGKERTLSQMAPFLEETDRALRETTWRLTTARRLVDRDAIDDDFRPAREASRGDCSRSWLCKLCRLRLSEPRTVRLWDCRNAPSFTMPSRSWWFRSFATLAKSAERHLGSMTLRPWDLAVDPLGRPPLRPFDERRRSSPSRPRAVFARIDPELAGQFQYMRTHGLLDLANRKGKAPGGYQTTFEDDRVPFIFMNAVGLDGDLRTLLHEGGHAFHTMASRGEPLAAYRDCPIEFCEVASMSMELFGARDLGLVLQRERRQPLVSPAPRRHGQRPCPGSPRWTPFSTGSTPIPDTRARSAGPRWIAILDRFGGGVDWSGFEDVRANLWHRQLHIFLYPFYYIEYGIAQLGALQIWRHSLRDRAAAVASYRKALGLGGSRPLPELFEAAGVPFGFAESTIAPLVDAVRSELESLGP